jgi:hypothetical protein
MLGDPPRVSRLSSEVVNTRSNMKPILAYAQLNARIMPLDRGERFEDPLIEALAENGYAQVSGGGTMQSKDGEIEYCGIDIDLFDVPKGVPFVCQFLEQLGAPKGSKLQYEWKGKKIEAPFGVAEGLAIYLNGTDLPDEVYKECDVNEVYDEINRLLGDRGAIQGHWRGPTETALYLYGGSADEMRKLIARYLAEYPLCQRARVVRIA